VLEQTRSRTARSGPGCSGPFGQLACTGWTSPKAYGIPEATVRQRWPRPRAPPTSSAAASVLRTCREGCSCAGPGVGAPCHRRGSSRSAAVNRFGQRGEGLARLPRHLGPRPAGDRPNPSCPPQAEARRHRQPVLEPAGTRSCGGNEALKKVAGPGRKSCSGAGGRADDVRDRRTELAASRGGTPSSNLGDRPKPSAHRAQRRRQTGRPWGARRSCGCGGRAISAQGVFAARAECGASEPLLRLDRLRFAGWWTGTWSPRSRGGGGRLAAARIAADEAGQARRARVPWLRRGPRIDGRVARARAGRAAAEDAHQRAPGSDASTGYRGAPRGPECMACARRPAR